MQSFSGGERNKDGWAHIFFRKGWEKNAIQKKKTVLHDGWSGGEKELLRLPAKNVGKPCHRQMLSPSPAPQDDGGKKMKGEKR